jgi:chemotaxis protein methyltransferase CheR
MTGRVNQGLVDGDFELLRTYLRRTAGLEFDESRRSGLATIMATRVAATGLGSVLAYLGALELPSWSGERQLLLDEVTIQETHFHRARPQIDALRDRILPDVLARAAAAGREAVVWSAGCSTGEEPFTLAMLMLEVAATMPSPPPMRVIGTDVSTAALQVGAAATYSGRTIDLAEPAAVARWLTRAPDGSYVVKEEVRRLVELRHHNLVTDPPPFPLDHSRTVDLIVCRHVTIYFSRSTTRTLVERFHRALVPDGWLLMGPAESLWQVSDVFALEPVGDAFAYRAATERRPVRASSTVPAQRSVAPAARALPPAAVPRRPRHDPRAVPLRVPVRAGVPAGTVLAAASDVRAAALASAQAAFDTGDYEGAALGAVKVLDADPVSSEAYVLLGHARLNAGDLEGAVQPLQKAVYLEPLAGHAHFLLAVALSAVQRPQQAAPSYRAAADTLPGVPAEALRRMLDGRQLQELVQLCRRLADAAEAGTDPIRRGA